MPEDTGIMVQDDKEAELFIDQSYVNLNNKNNIKSISESIKEAIKLQNQYSSNQKNLRDEFEQKKDFYIAGTGIKYLGDRTTIRPPHVMRSNFSDASLIYMNFTKDGALVIKEHKFQFDNPLETRETVSNVAQEASKIIKIKVSEYSNQIKNGDYTTDAIDSINWWGHCYIFVVMDKKEWDLHHKGSNIDFMHLASRKSGYFRNTTLYNGNFFLLKINSNLELPIFYCENHHLSTDGTRFRDPDIDGPASYKIDFVYRVKIEGSNQVRETIIIDPTGTNFGPP